MECLSESSIEYESFSSQPTLNILSIVAGKFIGNYNQDICHIVPWPPYRHYCSKPRLTHDIVLCETRSVGAAVC